MNKLAVIALGGNAILRSDQKGTIQEQDINVMDSLENIVFMIKGGYNIILSHGNGPQVGNIVMRNDAGEQVYNIAQMPLDICVADSQGGIGYMIERNLRNLLKKHGLKRDVVTLVSQVLVDKNDPAINNPSKRIGKLYSKEKAMELTKSKGWLFKDSPKKKGSVRRVVASPRPIEIFNRDSIARLAKEGVIVITVGGGGVPVYKDESGMLQPVEGVIDKDMASSVLAQKIGADEFYILTDVPFVYMNYGKENQEILEFLDETDTLKYLESGQFSEGSMQPKIKAALEFVQNGGEKSIITESRKLEDKSFGTKITLKYE
ncbi:carbamate kinase [Lutibacter sp.]|uniref:carbamate kinase n=1 Tax=Lutibacter sp. TaxID=1925666 RepID=UPI0025C0586C|nr:carbamate kinase [Lutibacter sp.]MCF6180833.1 carbamate kinase [Lutibacter sp.]